MRTRLTKADIAWAKKNGLWKFHCKFRKMNKKAKERWINKTVAMLEEG